ncbi:MAG: hypothetical protein LBC88_08655, partial [Spirochaetaceae bacterium]|nr:hypothetical protein [Spirochaetaceae bacterium]
GVGSSANHYSGTFDGGGKRLEHLYSYHPTLDWAGLFGYTQRDGLPVTALKNITIVSGSVTGRDYVGGIVGNAVTTEISGCSNAAEVTAGGNDAGGIAGWVESGSVTASVNTGIVRADQNAGGIVGWGRGIEITACSNAASGGVYGTISVGGIAGQIQYSEVFNSFNAAPVTSVGENSYYIGGVAGQMAGQITNITACYNTGAVLGVALAGGVAGYVIGNNNAITACYNTGDVGIPGGNANGGVVGGGWSTTLTACYNTGAVSGVTIAGGVMGIFDSGNITACYWLNLSGDGSLSPASANAGIGFIQSGIVTGSSATAFGSSDWPSALDDAEWGTGDGSGSGKYWKTLGGWNGGNYGRDSDFPKLWWEP